MKDVGVFSSSSGAGQGKLFGAWRKAAVSRAANQNLRKRPTPIRFSCFKRLSLMPFIASKHSMYFIIINIRHISDCFAFGNR
jgi:hypothetical protein